MLSNRVTFGVIALVAMVGAAGAGSWFASRGAAPAGNPAAAAVTTPPSTIPAVGGAVEATEAVMEDKDSAPAAGAPAPSATPAAPAASASAPASSSATAERPASRPKPRADRPVASQQKAPAPKPVQPAKDQRAANTADAQIPRPETQSAPADAHPVDTDRASAEPVAPAPPPPPQFLEVTVPADSVIGLQIDNALSSETAHVEDRVSARVTRDVRADGRVAIPAGSRVLGSVSIVDRGGRMKEQARLGVRFHTVILADGTELPLQTETIIREGESPAQASAAKIGGAAIGGAILGAILGGGKGAAIGGAVGGAGGTTAVMASDRRPAKIAAGAPVTVKVLSPVTVTVEKE
jgi:type IV secretory pathway VirB10-like protein